MSANYPPPRPPVQSNVGGLILAIGGFIQGFVETRRQLDYLALAERQQALAEERAQYERERDRINRDWQKTMAIFQDQLERARKEWEITQLGPTQQGINEFFKGREMKRDLEFERKKGELGLQLYRQSTGDVIARERGVAGAKLEPYLNKGLMPSGAKAKSPAMMDGLSGVIDADTYYKLVNMARMSVDELADTQVQQRKTPTGRYRFQPGDEGEFLRLNPEKYSQAIQEQTMSMLRPYIGDAGYQMLRERVSQGKSITSVLFPGQESQWDLKPPDGTEGLFNPEDYQDIPDDELERIARGKP